MVSKRIQAAVLSLTLLLPAEAALARTRNHRVDRTYATQSRPHHYSQTRGALIGAAVGAAIGHKSPVKGALIGAAVGTGVQYERNRQERRRHPR
jgi:phage tail tape-measure protein